MQPKTRRKAHTTAANSKLDDMKAFYEQFCAIPREEQMYIKGRMDSYNDKRKLETQKTRDPVNVC